MSLISELKRRNVIRVGLAYAVASWLLLQVIDVVGPILDFPDVVARYVLFLLLIGLLPALVAAWVFEWTPQGVKRENESAESGPSIPGRGRRLDRAITVTLALAVALLLFDRFVGSETEPAERPGEAAPYYANETAFDSPDAAGNAQMHKSVAVLPFVPLSNGPDDDYFADGLSEELINALGQVPGLLVTARTSAFYFKGRNQPVGDIAQQLGVAHVVEGSVRRAGEQLRITAKLIRATDGFQLWSETYDRRTEDSFAVQSDIAEKVTRALNVLLDEALRERMQSVGTRNVDAFIAFQKGIELYDRAHQGPSQISLLRQANREFEQAIALAPDLYRAYEYHTDLFTHVLISNATGELDGNVTETDVETAPAALQADYDRAVRHARTPAERRSASFGRTLLLGPWRGLAALADKAASSPGCDSPVWLHLLGPFPGFGEPLQSTYRRVATCDPLRVAHMIQTVALNLWIGRPGEAVRLARGSLQRIEHPLLSRYLVMALALSGDAAGAESAARRHIRAEDILFATLALVAAIRGDPAAADYQERYLGTVGSNDRESLLLEATRGNRNEANRLAGAIDGRPFGHVVLLQSIFFCFCGAPFDLEATPNFAYMLNESGLAWPPVSPYSLPLKDW